MQTRAIILNAVVLEVRFVLNYNYNHMETKSIHYNYRCNYIAIPHRVAVQHRRVEELRYSINGVISGAPLRLGAVRDGGHLSLLVNTDRI